MVSIKLNSIILMAIVSLLFVHNIAFSKLPAYKFEINTEVMIPYNFIDNKNNIRGINVDIVSRIFKNSNMSFTFNLYPWPRAYKRTLTHKNNGLISTAHTKQRKDLFKWVGPLVSGKGYLYKLKTRTDIKINNLEDAKKFTVAVVRGDVYQNLFESLGFEVGKNLMLFSYNEAYLQPFLLGKVDLILGSNIVLPYLLKELNSDINLLEPSAKMIDTAGNYLALNKETPDEIVEKLNLELQKIKDSGEFQKIIDSYKLKKRH